jgi:hypothetical protein
MWPDREVFAHPDYVRLFASGNQRSLCAIGQMPSGCVLYPFLLRPLAAEPWVESGETAWDLISPYGYGGAFAWNLTAVEAGEFWSRFEKWCTSQNVVSSFVRLSLFPHQILTFNGENESKQSNIIRSLDPTPDDLWMDYEHKVRKNVKRARESGLRFEIDVAGQRLDEFLAIYHTVMTLRDAEASYFFPRVFFESIVRDLAGQFAFFHIFQESRMVSTELVLISARHVYSFLGGTLPDAFLQRPNDLLKHEVILWARESGKQAYVLGGGYQGDDGIFRYKKSFAPSGSTPFHVGKKIHDPLAYARLIDQRRRWEQQGDKSWRPRSGWFPEYRA